MNHCHFCATVAGFGGANQLSVQQWGERFVDTRRRQRFTERYLFHFVGDSRAGAGLRSKGVGDQCLRFSSYSGKAEPFRALDVRAVARFPPTTVYMTVGYERRSTYVVLDASLALLLYVRPRDNSFLLPEKMPQPLSFLDGLYNALLYPCCTPLHRTFSVFLPTVWTSTSQRISIMVAF